MILDEKNLVVYFENIKIKLTRQETLLLSLLIKNKNKISTMRELIMFIYRIDKDHISYKYVFTNLVSRLNRTLYPYATIICKNNMGYILKVNKSLEEKNKINELLKEHEKTLLLYNKIEQKEQLEKEIFLLKKELNVLQ